MMTEYERTAAPFRATFWALVSFDHSLSRPVVKPSGVKKKEVGYRYSFILLNMYSAVLLASPTALWGLLESPASAMCLIRPLSSVT